MPTATCGNPKSPLPVVVVCWLTPVASLIKVILTLARTAPLGSATRPRILPPVLWARRRVELARQPRTNSQRAVQRAVDDGMGDLQAKGESFEIENTSL